MTIPIARAMQELVARHFGNEIFTYIVISAILVAFLISALHLYRKQEAAYANYSWLVLITAIFLGYTVKLGQKSPSEAVHFIQYGLLGILVYRALSHRFQDFSIYIAAMLICGIIGIIDEFVQWLTPKRYWGLRDIWINFFAAVLVQVAIAKGLKPKFIAGWPNRMNLRFLCRLMLVALVLLGLSMVNTPHRIAWYADRIPWLAFLKENESVMAEYGDLYDDSDIGVFRSRFSATELEQTDRKRAAEASKILDRYRGRSEYRRFNKIYTPISDPFLHEARVHLFSRDYSLELSSVYKDQPETYAKLLTTAFRENQIMEKYFTKTLKHSAYVWSPENLSLARRHLFTDEIFYSSVSRNVITRFNENQVAGFFLILTIGLALVHRRLGKH